MTILPHILRCLAALALLAQLALPFAQAHAASTGAELSRFLCNPSGQSASDETLQALEVLLDVLDEDAPQNDAPDCERCVTPSVTLLSVPSKLGLPAPYSRPEHTVLTVETLHPAVPCGPPCGLRAPPVFV